MIYCIYFRFKTLKIYHANVNGEKFGTAVIRVVR